MKEARFLSINEKLHLVVVSYENNVIKSVDGPVQCVSDPGVSAPAFIALLTSLCAQALYNKPVLLLADLPEDVRDQIKL